MNRWLIVVLLVGAVVLPVYACSVPRIAYKDQDLGLTDLEAGVLKTEASRWSDFYASFSSLQIIEAHRDRSGEPGRIHGVVVWRTVFGIEYARSEIDGQYKLVWKDGEFQRAWLMLIAPEFAMIGLASILFLRSRRKSA